MKKESATIYDVAELAFVSIATVSRVLNGSANVRPETRERVDEAIKKLQFVPSAAARSLSGGRRWSIGLAYPLDEDRSTSSPVREDDTSVLYTDAIIRGASWQASQMDYSLFACAVSSGNKNKVNPLQQLYTSVDGIIFADRVVNNVRAMRIAKRLHTVHLSGSGDSRFGGTVRIDNAAGMQSIVDHLASVHGIQDFGFVGGSSDSPDATARLNAFLAEVAKVGGSVRTENILTADFSLVRAEDVIKQRFEMSSPLPRAFVCANDQMALGVLHVLRERGLHVPSDIAVTGFDDVPLARTLTPALTTVSQPSFELGQAAVNMVIALLDGTIGIGTVETLPAHLVVRESCGCTKENVE